ncbi:hypothetical protein A3C21_03405 [Candidatus Kaiserbacteria bacterium RIFCSPHIGHO2_02_FULL_59_21]|uniref:Uncharacterized protein n=2 Tax=Candidatus Kaiseribacteriota TaxID=1752734 RepID=A0A0G2B1T4_9BACT|nr:MAG: hypothetical protein UY98_C0003G0002 [Candidatus Kaiserbacteria bacterium GW2011_GWA2_58_9]OGG61684.1 MAG: hypothetical protein A2766_03160 [Candidatus Kaiserbacteria bacterium RIFCSPHIGHO2_01_FULL_58_22]OGG66928.1 MAG: hypothetical protein A3C21_03405 [Candidatus Kaiserbacteria bacterium RIFCSPHIGHO2_02_FULL_59_21]OGG80459.1 MAG: hypothetical protein A2952_02655 [Candidatus Kaiserbacteria bacterium RIFCSPLOWO2_01_FULL_59_34]OGG86265.1 MAG: hypothetical protein A3I47_02495 [Candidatus K
MDEIKEPKPDIAKALSTALGREERPPEHLMAIVPNKHFWYELRLYDFTDQRLILREQSGMRPGHLKSGMLFMGGSDFPVFLYDPESRTASRLNDPTGYIWEASKRLEDENLGLIKAPEEEEKLDLIKDPEESGE